MNRRGRGTKATDAPRFSCVTGATSHLQPAPKPNEVDGKMPRISTGSILTVAVYSPVTLHFLLRSGFFNLLE